MPSRRARELRKSPTDAERRLWYRLRNRQLDGFRFRRQQPVGPYIVDFFCPDAKLILELDGGQHLDATEYDRQRTDWLEARGYRVMRFWNNEVFEKMDGVLESIRVALRDRQ